MIIFFLSITNVFIRFESWISRVLTKNSAKNQVYLPRPVGIAHSIYRKPFIVINHPHLLVLIPEYRQRIRSNMLHRLI